MSVHLKFGEMAIQMRLLTVDQVEEGLRAQEEARRCGSDRSLGAWLHDKGFIDLVQVENILATLGLPPERCAQIPNVRLKSLLGRGANGAVYRGYCERLRSEVAVKVRASKNAAEDPDGRRFRAEAKIAVRLAHPHIVRLHDVGETRDYVYQMLELVEGESLDAILKREQRIAEFRVIEIGIQMASALEYAAQHSIVHRDIKPANILIAKDGAAKLCDLGLAKDLHAGTVMTAEGVLLGSPFYIAPEYAREGRIDHRSDVYSLGVTLYHAATGAVPFPGKTVMEILESVVNLAAADPRTVAPELSSEFATTVLRMMAKNPDDRFQTAAEVAAALRAIGGRSSATISVDAPPEIQAMAARASGARATLAPPKPSLWRRVISLFSKKP